MKRKDFIINFIAGGSVLLAAPVFFNSCSDDVGSVDAGDGNGNTNTSEITIDLNSGDYAALKTVGGFAYSGSIIIVRTSENQYIALSKICTHQGCTVSFSGSQVVCPCHGSKFDTSGNVLEGPATTSLKKYTVTLNGSTLKII